MKMLERYLLKKAHISNNSIIKVDSFLNHQVDPRLIKHITKRFYEHFKDYQLDRIVTVESSGIALAMPLALKLNLPLTIFKKANEKTPGFHTYECHSYTKNNDYFLSVKKDYLKTNERVLLIDDFLAQGQVALASYELCKQAKANLVGVGIVISKGFQDGERLLKAKKLELFTLVSIKEINDNKLVFENKA